MRVLVMPDLHAPFHHAGAIRFLRKTAKRYKTDAVVNIGDLGDQHGWSRYGRLPDALSQREEDARCLEFCDELYTHFPHVLACVGNHDERLAKRCSHAGVPSRLHRSVAEIYASPAGWKWANSWVIDGVAYQHGEGFSGKDVAIKAALSNRKPTVCGHIHSAAGVQYSAGPFDVVWGMAVGCLIDPESAAFSYARKTSSKPVFGCGVVLDGEPHFVPMR